MKQFFLSLLLAGTVLGQTIKTPVTVDPATGLLYPRSTNGHVLDLPTGTTVNGSLIPNSGLAGGTLGHVITASGATTITDSGTLLSSLAVIPSSLSQFSGGSFALRQAIPLAKASVDGRITGVTPGATSQNLYTTRDNSGAGTYVRSTAHILSNVNLTGVAVYSSLTPFTVPPFPVTSWSMRITLR